MSILTQQIGKTDSGVSCEVKVNANNDELALLKTYAIALRSYKLQNWTNTPMKGKPFKAVTAHTLGVLNFLDLEQCAKIERFEQQLYCMFKSFSENVHAFWCELKNGDVLSYWEIKYGLIPDTSVSASPKMCTVMDETLVAFDEPVFDALDNQLHKLKHSKWFDTAYMSDLLRKHETSSYCCDTPGHVTLLEKYAQISLKLIKEDSGLNRTVENLRQMGLISSSDSSDLAYIEAKSHCEFAYLSEEELELLSNLQATDKITFSHSVTVTSQPKPEIKDVSTGSVGSVELTYLDKDEVSLLRLYAQARLNFMSKSPTVDPIYIGTLGVSGFLSQEQAKNLVSFEENLGIDLTLMSKYTLRTLATVPDGKKIGRSVFVEVHKRVVKAEKAENLPEVMEKQARKPGYFQKREEKDGSAGQLIGEIMLDTNVVNLKVSPFDPNELDLQLDWAKKQFQRGSEFAGGLDLLAAETVTIGSKQVIAVKTGICTEFNADYQAVIKERSGRALDYWEVHGGVIDSDYRGEWKVILRNSSNAARSINKGDKIAQVLFVKVPTVNVEVVEHSGLLLDTSRGHGGFGSTGQ